MRLLVFSIFFLFSVVKSYSTPIIINGDMESVQCSSDSLSAKVLSPQRTFIATEWREDYIHPMQVCVTVTGPRVLPCKLTNKSEITLFIRSRDESRENMTVPIALNNFDAANVYCHTFSASEMASQLKHKNLKGAAFAVRVFLFGVEKSDKPSTFQVSIRFAPYFIDKPGGEAIADKSHKLHAVVCKFPKCIVTAEGPFKAVKTENFHIRENLAPQYEKEHGLLTDNMISVTYFECEAECPTKFIASTAPAQTSPEPPQDTTILVPQDADADADVPLAVTTKPSNAPYHICVGNFVVAAILVLEA